MKLRRLSGVGLLLLSLFLPPHAIGASKRLPREVRGAVRQWWRREGNTGRPKTERAVLPGGRRLFLRVLIDDPRYRGATGNATYLYFVKERSGWRFLMDDAGIGAFARAFGPNGYPWLETYGHDSADKAGYRLWAWDARSRRYVLRKEWVGPYPKRQQFVSPPGGFPRGLDSG